jgi:cyclopropane-fatty-acyl-phospholipid synthase
MFRTGAQMAFQMQLARTRDAAPLTRDYQLETERRYLAEESGDPEGSAWKPPRASAPR